MKTVADEGGGLERITLTNTYGEVVVHTLGATVLSYRDRGGVQRLWLSKNATFEQGKAIRGGIPVCWPWFGKKANSPSHGVARTALWTVADQTHREGCSTVTLTLEQSNESLRLWPFPFHFELTVVLDEQGLSVTLTHTNTSERPVVCGGALHAYFQVKSHLSAFVTGMKGCKALNKLTGDEEILGEEVGFGEPIDQIIWGVRGPVVLNNQVQLTTSSSTVVVWNPGEKRPADASSFHDFVCVEAAKIAPDDVILAPGAVAMLRLLVQPLV